MHKKLWLHQFVLVVSLILISAWRIISGGWSFDLVLLWWWMGAVIGFGFVFLDRLVHLYTAPQEDPFVKFIRGLIQRRQFGVALGTLLSDRHAPRHLFMRSVLFLAAWVVVGLLAMTSSSSVFGRGFVFGLGLHLAFDLLTDYLGKAREVELWFWQIKRVFEPQEITAVVWGYLILFLLIAWFL
jgi:hypothetical protein